MVTGWCLSTGYHHSSVLSALHHKHLAQSSQAAAILKAEVHGVQLPEWAHDASRVAAEAGGVVVPEFVPRSGVRIETDPKADKPVATVADDESVIEGLVGQLAEVSGSVAPGYKLAPVSCRGCHSRWCLAAAGSMPHVACRLLPTACVGRPMCFCYLRWFECCQRWHSIFTA